MNEWTDDRGLFQSSMTSY